ncbi:MAG: helix-turn-helix domain-containing protein [Pseudomonadota bacterium]
MLEAAGREIGDPYIGGALGRMVSVDHLGAYGVWMREAPTLANLIDRCQRGVGRYLQTATRIQLRVVEAGAELSIEFLDERDEPWLQNELLGVSYLIDCVRQFAGRSWSPALISSTAVGAESASVLETPFEAPVRHGAEISLILFDPALLTATSLGGQSAAVREEPVLPDPRYLREDVSALVAISLLERQPKVDWVAARAGMSRRSLQRVLDSEGCTFSEILEGLLKDRAIELLRSTDHSVTDVGLSLGYSDGAHFTRAFRRWTGFPPSTLRRAAVGDARN